ncbi:MAG: ABC transporter permease subunit [Pseudomonadota bacterium]|nr:ABC transporter permease subunit [Pseudomonadota bacterium]
MTRVKARIGPAAAILAGVVLWALVAARVGPLLLAGPLEVLQALVTERARLSEATVRTALAAVGGLGLATLLGLTLAIGAWWSRTLRAALLPYTVVLQVVPIVAIAPLLVVWLGYGTPVALATATLAAFYPVYSAATTGLAAPARELVDLFRLYGATRASELWLLRLPAAMPALFSGLRSAAGLAVIGAIVGEFVGSNGYPPTLGYLVVYAARSARPDLCFAAIVGAASLAFALHALLRQLESRAIGRWYGN